ncbi:AraC family transcriptional regulator [Paenibacillus sp. 1001270B_150601_E10]|uniref:AraC family transcriptional regulator n=1 Tax=Paenibacillus sp. 1001270B_150601_E10 TaxID=2787079 RepID=UPI0018A0E50C|nr:AraC family transcriptional regulator [Paenibacillus sp. 1001270B_150601_E10]
MRLSPVLLHSSDMQWNIQRRTELPFDGYYHWHSCCEFLLIHKGQGSVVVNQKRYDMEPGTLFLFRPFELHRVHALITPEHPYERSIIYFDPISLEQKLEDFISLKRFFNKLYQMQNGESAFSLQSYLPMMEALFGMLLHDYKEGASRQKEEDAFICFIQLLRTVQTAGRHLSERMIEAGNARLNKDSEKMMKWIEEHYQEPFELERLAKDIHLSKSHVSRVFRHETGSSITSYLLARRLKEACKLLEASDCSVEEITSRIGLTNTSYFIQMFKKHFGITPYQYRKQGGF